MRLIDMDLAISKCVEDMEAVKDLPQRLDGIRDAVMNIYECPTINAVPVVRCKECKHLSNDRITPEFDRVCRLYGCGKKEYGFCDEGERRTDE